VKVIFADRAYSKMGLPDGEKQTFGGILQTVLRPVGVRGFVVLPKRWGVERTFAGIIQYRRHAKDDERNPESGKAMIHIAMTNRRLKPPPTSKNSLVKTGSDGERRSIAMASSPYSPSAIKRNFLQWLYCCHESVFRMRLEVR
jgi:hypothetical protein